METRWQPTRHGGLRRTRAAQIMGTPDEAPHEAEAIARVGVEGGGDAGQYLEGHSSDKGEVGGSNPSPRTSSTAGVSGMTSEHPRGESPGRRAAPLFKYHGREALGLETCPYVIRWRVETPYFSVRLHHWLAPDDDRAKHDHPWSFTTFVLKGGYTDSSPTGDEHLRAPCIRRRAATHQHTVFPDPGGAWTVVVTGPKVRNWGFWVKGKFVKMNKYFLTYGHHPCD